MADRTFSNVRIKHKRDTSANWTTNNPVLLEGEIIIVDTNESGTRLKVGDGTKTYTQLPFIDELLYNSLSDKAEKSEVPTVTRYTTQVTADDTTTITIPFTVEDLDKLTVYLNGLLLTPTIHYTATTTSITLNGYKAMAGDIISFITSIVDMTSALDEIATVALEADYE